MSRLRSEVGRWSLFFDQYGMVCVMAFVIRRVLGVLVEEDGVIHHRSNLLLLCRGVVV